jgi:membrane protein YdbS with pleckstrin-like domain
MHQTLYDADVLQQQADELYRQAGSIVFLTTIKYVLITVVVVLVVLAYVSSINPQIPVGGPSLIAALIAAGLGISHGRAKAFHLKLEAQTLLCQRQIELNTRLAP